MSNNQKPTEHDIQEGKKFTSKLLEEAKKLAMQGYLPVIQGKQIKMNAEGKYVKYISSGQRYKHVTDPAVALVNLERYLAKNPNKNGDESNTLGIRMSGVVNIDFDNMEEYKNFLKLGLIEDYNVATTKVNRTPRGIHYLYQTPPGWETQFNKTTHIEIDGAPSDIDVLFGDNAIEHVYPSYVHHPVDGRLEYQRINENKIAVMPDKLRVFLEQRLNKVNHPQRGPDHSGVPSQGMDAPNELIERLIIKLSEFGYKDPKFVRLGAHGFDFTYDHSIPDPLDTRVTHDHIDGYVIINEDTNSAIVGTYSDKCKPKSKLLCALEEPNHNEWFDSIEDGDVVNDIHMIKYENRFVQPFHDEHPETGEPVLATLVMSDMGTGKSHQVLNHIHKHNPKSVLILTPRIMFGQTLQHRLNGGIKEVKDHFKLYNQEGVDRCISDPRIICQMESLHRLGTTYDHIYIDEIESCLACFSSDTMAKKRIECVSTFSKLIKEAKRIVFCDAHISDRTIGLLSDFGIPKSKIVIERNTFQPNQRSAYRVPYCPFGKKLPKILELLELKLREGKNIVFATSSKSFLLKIEALAKRLLKPSEFVCYCADSKDKEKLIEVEREWGNKRLVAYNTTISVGIDFNIPHFDLLFVHAVNFHCGPVRDIFQSMHRVRQLKDNILYYSLSTSSHVDKPVTTLAGAREHIRNCRELAWQGKNGFPVEPPLWLTNLHVHNEMEKGKSQDDYAGVFDKYLEMCGYKKKTTSLNDDSDVEFEDIIVAGAEIPDYDAIPEINWLDINSLKRRVFYDPSCTQEEKHSLIKYEYNDLGYEGKEAFGLMFSKEGRDYLKNFAREQTQTVEDVLQQEKDYAMFTETAAVKLDVALNLVKTLNLEHSTDTETQFTAKEIMDNIDRLNELLRKLDVVNKSDARRESKRLTGNVIETKAPYVETKNRASKAFESYSGAKIVNARTKTGKGTATKKIDGKQYPVYQLEGINLGKYFTKPNFQKLIEEEI